MMTSHNQLQQHHVTNLCADQTGESPMNAGQPTVAAHLTLTAVDYSSPRPRLRRRDAFWNYARTTTISSSSSSSSLCRAALVMVLCCISLSASIAPDNSLTLPHVESGICPSIDVRNSVDNFRKLENCTVIEGVLQILLIDHAIPSDYDNLTFPRLREITGYFLLFRVTGLRSLRSLFPNLAVIRGSQLFHNYGLVVYEMLHLQEISLPRLSVILRGAVRIEKNPNLCYVSTIDWDLIATNGKEGHFIKGNKFENECPNQCPPAVKCLTRTPLGRHGQELCWNGDDCQKVCSPKCIEHRQFELACNELGDCCHRECLGGCSGDSQTDCDACRNVIFEGKCLESCSTNTFEYLERRCVTERECFEMNSTDPRFIDKKVFFKPFQQKCTLDCPPGFTEDRHNRHKCVLCQGECPKECNGAAVDSVAAAQELRGCTRILGSLEIEISGGQNVVDELEENLSQIKEITGYLKVVRSYPLKSLNFLKNLQKIHGQLKQSSEYALYVFDNHNLNDLWNWENRPHGLEIGEGKVFFHLNPKLCLDKIRRLQTMVNITRWDDRDVSNTSNGDKVACEHWRLAVEVTKKAKNVVIIRWTNFLKNYSSEADQRLFLGYVVSYKEVAYGNVTLFDDHDACSSDSWKVDDVPPDSNSTRKLDEHGKLVQVPDYVWHLVTRLKSYTRYALYVKTYTIASGRIGAQSDIIYFTTEPDIPTYPVSLEAWSNSSSHVIVLWRAPNRPSGIVTHYIVTGELEEDSQEFLDLRNFCDERHTSMTYKGSMQNNKDTKGYAVEMTTEPTEMSPESKKCCKCPKDKKQIEEEERERQFQIQFENVLHNTVYVKRSNESADIGDMSVRRRSASVGVVRREAPITVYSAAHVTVPVRNRQRRDVPDRTGLNDVENSLAGLSVEAGAASSTAHPIDLTQDHMGNDTFRVTVYNATSVAIGKLVHFAGYTIRVIACHDYDPKTKRKLCSSEAFTTVRTLPSEDADNIDDASVVISHQNKTSESSGSILMQWKIPPNPNGLIVSFDIEIKSADSNQDHSKSCISHKRYVEHNGFTTSQLPPGNYSARVRAMSLAKHGEWTSFKYFHIERVPYQLAPEWLTIIILVSVVVVILISCIGYVAFRKRFGPQIPDSLIYASVNPEYLSASEVYIPDGWEVPRDKIVLLKELGQGSFGMVYEGQAKDIGGKPFVKCAVKTVNVSATMRERLEFLNEASVMKDFSCNHVVQLMGVVSKGQPTLVIMELMANGDLKSYLRTHRPDLDENKGVQPPTLKRILQMAIEIADGMSYLSEKKYVHRDLAARNCMVAEDLTVKIGDFGMTRDIYETDYYRKGGKGLLPVRWMGPESLKDGVFTSQSDVWSYGVVLWEMATLASQPYQGLSNEQVLKYVIDGGVMEKPVNCPEKLYELMRVCWQYNPKSRPTFVKLIEILFPEASSSFREVSFYTTGRDNKQSAAAIAGAIAASASGAAGCAASSARVLDIDEEEGEDEASPTTPLRSQQEKRDSSCRLDIRRKSVDDDEEEEEKIYSQDEKDNNDEEERFELQRHNGKHRTTTPHSLSWSCPPDTKKQQTYSASSGVASYLTGDGSKGLSISSSDGSKASACSANGSVVNGHLGMWPPVTSKGMAEC